MTVGDWDRRELCPDGTCVGLIGPSGTCKVCGRAAPNWGEERKRGLANTSPPDASVLRDEADPSPAAAPDPIAPSTPARIGDPLGAWNSRQLCSDGACVGVIGPSGVCKVCGKPGDAAAGTASADEDDAYENEDEDEDEDEDDEAGDDAYEDDGEAADDDDAADDDELEHAAAELADVATAGEIAAADQIAAAADDDDRKLCPDGGCVGLIGPDGRCKVCGKEAA